MTVRKLTISLPDALYAELTAIARRAGKPAQWVTDLVAAELDTRRSVHLIPPIKTPVERAEASIRKVMQSRHRCTVRELKQATASKSASVNDWDKALAALCSAGEVRVAEEDTKAGRKRKVVILQRV
jgi:hypothetical protein